MDIFERFDRRISDNERTIAQLETQEQPSASLAVHFLGSILVADPVAYVEWLDLPSQYASLRVVASLRSAAAVTGDAVLLRLNGNTGGNYSHFSTRAAASGLTYAEETGGTALAVGECPGASALANSYGALSLTLPAYAASAYKPALFDLFSLFSTSAGGGARYSGGGSWRSAEPISTVRLFLQSGGNFAAGSSVTLYADR